MTSRRAGWGEEAGSSRRGRPEADAAAGLDPPTVVASYALHEPPSRQEPRRSDGGVSPSAWWLMAFP